MNTELCVKINPVDDEVRMYEIRNHTLPLSDGELVSGMDHVSKS